MRKRTFAWSIVLLALFGTLLWLTTQRTGRIITNVVGVSGSSNTVAGQIPPSPRAPSIAQALVDAVRRGKTVLDAKDSWRTPIEFFGKVIDDDSNPVFHAEIQLAWTDTSTQGHSERVVYTDTNGNFALKGVGGYALTIRALKDGYYTSKSNQPGFFYAGQDSNFVANSSMPIVFHLKKKRSAEPLIVIRGAGLRTMRDFLVPKDGSPVEISLSSGKQVASGLGDFKVQCWTRDEIRTGRGYDWKCRLSVPDGGIQESSQEFPFLAPEDGYLPAIEIEMPANLGERWSVQAERQYFIRSKSGSFARIRFIMIAGGGHFFRLESFLNPTGSRNLEYDPAVQPQNSR